MSNVFKKVDMLGSEALMHLEDALVLANLCMKDVSSDFNQKPAGYAVGDTIRFKTRPMYEAKEFTSTIETQGVRETNRSLLIEKHFDVSIELTAKELALDFESFSDQVIKPSAYALAQKVDVYLGTKILQAQGLSVATSILSDAAGMAIARKDANYQQLNPIGRFGVVDPTLEARLLGASYFNTASTRGSDAERTMREGEMGRAMGIDWFGSQSFPEAAHTSNSGSTTVDSTVATNNLVGTTTLVVDAVTTGFTAGDRLRIAGCRRPVIVASNVSAAATSIPITNPLTEIVTDGAAVTVIGSGETQTIRGAIFDMDSIAAAFPILDLPEDKAAAVTSDGGVSIRIVKGYDLSSKKTTMSLDLLVGAFALDPRRITLLGDSA